MAARQMIKNRWVLAGLSAVIAVLAGDRLMSLSTQPDLPRYSFAVAIEGRVLGAFTEVAGLNVELDVIEFREGTGGPVRFIPGETKWSRIELKRGFNGDTGLYDWFTEFSQSPTERVDGSIVMLDQTQREVARWNFENAWPSKVTGPILQSQGNDVPIESIVLVHEGLSRVPQGAPAEPR